MNSLACILLVTVCVSAISALPTLYDDGNMWERSGKFEGDILVHPSQVGKNGVRDSRSYWPSRTMYYTISSSFTASQRNSILDAINDYNTNTCVRLVQRTNQANYIAIGGSQSGCYSYVGMVGGAQEVNYGSGCFSHGTIMHEMLHALGFWHMQSTYNRDDFVRINWENIQAGTENNFAKYTSAQVNDFGVKYDYGSVMHYSRTAFSSNGKETITPTATPNAAIGQRVGLSSSDIKKLNAMYGC